jgi:transcriptional regulator with XRE-family HTH domain
MVEGNMTGERRTGAKPRRRPLVGGQIRRLRTDRGLTLARVGELTGLNLGYLSQVETDKASPSLETLAAVADALEVPLSWLLVESVPPPGLRTELHADPGEEHHLLLEGRLRLRQGEHAVDLEPGDYLLWDGSVPHEVENIGDGPARTLIITTGPAGLTIAGDGEAPARDEGTSPS